MYISLIELSCARAAPLREAQGFLTRLQGSRSAGRRIDRDLNFRLSTFDFRLQLDLLVRVFLGVEAVPRRVVQRLAVRAERGRGLLRDRPVTIEPSPRPQRRAHDVVGDELPHCITPLFSVTLIL